MYEVAFNLTDRFNIIKCHISNKYKDYLSHMCIYKWVNSPQASLFAWKHTYVVHQEDMHLQVNMIISWL